MYQQNIWIWYYNRKIPKIDPKKQKNGDNFFSTSLINVYLNINFINFDLVFWLDSKSLVVWTCWIFFKPSDLKKRSLLQIKINLPWLQQKNDFSLMVVILTIFCPLWLSLNPATGWKSSHNCVVLVCCGHGIKMLNWWWEIGCIWQEMPSFLNIQKMFLGGPNS